MPYVLAYNRAAIEDKMKRLAAWLDLPKRSFDGVMDWVLALRREIGIPHTLKELGVDASRLDELSAMAEADPSTGGNPVPVGARDMRIMFERALEGRLA
jgi:alcohol dehydrogenase class IV